MHALKISPPTAVLAVPATATPLAHQVRSQPHGTAPTDHRSRAALLAKIALVVLFALGALALAMPSHALDLVGFSGLTGPLTPFLTIVAGLTPSLRAVFIVVGFLFTVGALVAAARFSGVVATFLGLVLFVAVGLPIAGTITGAVL